MLQLQHFDDLDFTKIGILDSNNFERLVAYISSHGIDYQSDEFSHS